MDRLSAFMDGESSPAETHQALLRLNQDAECRETWSTFHLIGDVMRGDALMHEDFMTLFHARMESEPTQLAPRRTQWRKYAGYGLSAAASVSAIAIVASLVFTDNPLLPKQGEQIVVADPQRAATVQQVAPRPAAVVTTGKLNEYLMAHQEYSPSTAIQGVAPYVRTISETHDGNNR